jgi:3-dehydroquinate dehydratase
MPLGGWINRHIIEDLPEQIDRAYQQFNHAAFTHVNVAMRNDTFKWELG